MNSYSVVGNPKIKISEIQDSRMWIHSEELGYGCWVSNNILKDIVKSKSIKMVSASVQEASK